ncbi:MAG: hypothetical protein MZV63_37555 [Marinilabiliales bacterium]|nr:hypothetical protein [Marinilabiliales bacterium]
MLLIEVMLRGVDQGAVRHPHHAWPRLLQRPASRHHGRWSGRSTNWSTFFMSRASIPACMTLRMFDHAAEAKPGV